ncbi:MAG: T9SS type A sorting domain-containing protein, partial [candidate division Zixibacteria bacterium]|nr:T9SS type A sorting domain-containing protein [candidate division Zixibacteria bacterium]
FPDHVPVDLGSMAEYPSGYDESPSQPPAKDFIQHYSEGWNMAVILAHGICEGFVSMSSGYNQWPKTYVWIGSGGRSDKGYLDNLENYGRSGIIYSVSCSQGAFDRDNSESRCFAEYITNLEDRGAAAFIGYSRYGWVASSYKLAEKFVETVYTADNRIGPANTISKLHYSSHRDLNYGLNLFGDPSLLIWTETPNSIEVEHPEIISLGDNSFTISANTNDQALDNALVTIITEDDNLICNYTDLNGLLDLNFNTGIDSSVVLTVSKNGFKPYQAEIYTSIVLDADDEDDYDNIPRAYELNQNYPNPANPATNIGFYIPRRNDISLEIFNLLGQKVFSVEEYGLEIGYHEIEIDLSNYPSGVYLYRLNAAEFSNVRKLVLLK